MKLVATRLLFVTCSEKH